MTKKMATRTKGFKHAIYVILEDDGDKSYMIAAENEAELAEIGETIPVGLYELANVFNLKAEVKLDHD